MLTHAALATARRPRHGRTRARTRAARAARRPRPLATARRPRRDPRRRIARDRLTCSFAIHSLIATVYAPVHPCQLMAGGSVA